MNCETVQFAIGQRIDFLSQHTAPGERRTNPALEKKVKLNSIDFVRRLCVPPHDAPPPPMVRLNYFSNSPQQLAKLLLTFLLPLLLLCLVRLFVSALSIGGRFVRKKNSHQSSFHFLRSVQRVALGALERLQLQHKLAPLLCVAPSPVARKMWWVFPSSKGQPGCCCCCCWWHGAISKHSWKELSRELKVEHIGRCRLQVEPILYPQRSCNHVHSVSKKYPFRPFNGKLIE